MDCLLLSFIWAVGIVVVSFLLHRLTKTTPRKLQTIPNAQTAARYETVKEEWKAHCSNEHTLKSLDQLLALYNQPLATTLAKEIYELDTCAKKFILNSTLFMLGTASELSGTSNILRLDVSPRGDPAGCLCEIGPDNKTIYLPDRRGNNRLDSLRNIIINPSVAGLFIVPRVHETFRISGLAYISVDPQLLEKFIIRGQVPKCVIVIRMIVGYMQCSRAFVRSNAWKLPKSVENGNSSDNTSEITEYDACATDRPVPTMGECLQSHTQGKIQAAEYDQILRTRVPSTLY